MKDINATTEQEFERIFNEYWHRLYAFAYNILREKQASEDCIQNVFVDYWKRSKSLEILNTKAYLFQAVKYQCAKILVIQKRFNYGMDLTEIIAEPEAHTEEKIQLEQELIKELHEKIKLLPEKCQKVFRYSKFDKKTNKEIASELGVSVSTVENHMNKALRFLRKSLPEHLYVLVFLLY